MKVKRHGQGEILSPKQIDSLFTYGLLTPRERALFGICLYTSARISEACKLYQEDCYHDLVPREKIILRKGNTKGKKISREIPSHPNLIKLLNKYLQSEPRWQYTDYVFPGRGGFLHLSPKWADRLLRDGCKRVGLIGVSTHSFRRTCLSAMSDAGVPLRHIQSISGHANLAALQRYLGVTDEQKKKAISNLPF